jgi:hypothetical protein
LGDGTVLTLTRDDQGNLVLLEPGEKVPIGKIVSGPLPKKGRFLSIPFPEGLTLAPGETLLLSFGAEP